MYPTNTLREKWKQFLIILVPILITQLSLLGMNFFDTVMSGHASKEDLAGVAIGASIWVPVFTGLTGVVLALTPIVAQLVGAQMKERVPFQIFQGILLVAAISVMVIIGGILFLNKGLTLLDLEPKVREVAYYYLVALSLGLAPVLIYTVLRCFVEALGHTSVTMVMTLISLPINVALNYILIFGKLGLPAMGGVGAGIASALTYWFLLFFAILVVQYRKPFSDFHIFGKFYAVSISTWSDQLRLGIPIGLSVFLETSIFSAVTLFMSEFSTVTIAGHQAAINFSSLLYMIPMSISMALTITVGYEVGGGRYGDAKQYSHMGIWVAVLLATLTAICLFLFREQVAGLYTADSDVLAMTSTFLMYAVFFQLSDAIAAPIQGALRGYKDVNVTFIVALVSYWILGLPVGILLAKRTALGPYGYWVGLISGLAFGAAFLLYRLRDIQKEHSTRQRRNT